MFKKFRDFSGIKFSYPFNFTQPNMAFTPRQIIEQFASGEVIAQENTPSDEFYDDKYSDDDLASLVQLDDDFQARQAVIDFQIEQQENETKTSNQVRDGASPATTPSTEPVPAGDGSVPVVGTEQTDV